ncbi:MAG: hypothetical protein KF866_02280 [Phycisphaeraceae bacterium]|nr:hypothetical protein [Phycisphaeraceae bacterium]MCW5753479.1 hypothetical protein [Phycisphaeraceae bacterium]
MSAIGATAAGGLGAGVSPTGLSALSSQDFLKLIFAELGKQDPLKPTDTTTLLNQIADIRAIQSDMDMGERLGALVGQNEMASAAGLLGRRVGGLTESNMRAEGEVDRVWRTSMGVVLELQDGSLLRMSRVDQILPLPAQEGA